MNLKTRLLVLTMLINALSFGAKYEAELVVSGEDIVERIEDTICNSDNGIYDGQAVDHYLDGGKSPLREALWIENKGTVHNLGTVISTTHKYNSQAGGVVVGGVNNPLKKTDNLVQMFGGSNLYNDGLISMGSTDHHSEEIVNLLNFVPLNYSNYTKNVINAENSNIFNRGTIEAKGDTPKYSVYLGVTALKTANIKVNKNVVNMKNSSFTNNGKIDCQRDNNIEFLKGVSVELLNIGIYYDRNVAGVNATGGTVVNNNHIFVGGDVLLPKKYSGIGIQGLGLDFEGNHTKYGIKSTDGKVINTGLIEVERDFTYGKDQNGYILKLELIKNEVLGLDLLSFQNFYEKSIGVSMEGGTFYNNGGTIKVGANHKDRLLQIYDNAAIAVQANAGAEVVFNETGRETSTIELEGPQIWLGSLNDYSKMTLNGTTDVIIRTKNKPKEGVRPEIVVNKDIFGNDGTGEYIINGDLNIRGEELVYGEVKDENGKVIGSEVVDKKEFDTDIIIGDTSNVQIGVNYEYALDENGEIKKDENGNPIIQTKQLGKLNVQGKLDIQSNIKVDSLHLVGETAEELEHYKGNTIVHADNGITGTEKVTSDSFMFTVKSATDKTNANIIVDSIKRKNFNDIVRNSELGNIFETSYDTANSEQLEVYRLLAQGEDQAGFDKAVDEVTGKDTLVTLPAQIYDITRDLNGQFKDFAINNNSDGLVFKYINSKSELGADSKTVGFDRKSSGIMVGYNNNISEKLRVGTGFAYMKSDIDYTSNSKNKVTTWNIRGYSDYDLGFAKIFNDLSFGYNQSENRRMADQVAYTGLKEGDLDIYTLSLNNSLYKDYKINDRFSLTPSLNLDFTYINQEDFKENGKLGASADKIDTYYITAGVGAKAKYNLLTYENSKIDLVGGINYAYDIYRDSEDMSLKVSAFNPYYKEELRELDKKSLDLNIGLDYSYKDKYSVGLNYTKELINDVENDQIGVDFTYKF